MTSTQLAFVAVKIGSSQKRGTEYRGGGGAGGGGGGGLHLRAMSRVTPLPPVLRRLRRPPHRPLLPALSLFAPLPPSPVSHRTRGRGHWQGQAEEAAGAGASAISPHSRDWFVARARRGVRSRDGASRAEELLQPQPMDDDWVNCDSEAVVAALSVRLPLLACERRAAAARPGHPAPACRGRQV